MLSFNPKRCRCGRIAWIQYGWPGMEGNEGPEYCGNCATACGDECCGFNYAEYSWELQGLAILEEHAQLQPEAL